MSKRSLLVALLDEDQKRLEEIMKALQREREGQVTQVDAIRYALRQTVAQIKKEKRPKA